MSTVTATYAADTANNTASAAHKVTNILKLTYGLVPIAAGADKFMHLLVNWDQYLATSIANILPVDGHSFMLIVGVIEILAGILVVVKPRLGSIVVAFWLLGIVLNLLIGGQYLDVAVRDVVMAIGAFCLFLLTNNRRD